MKLFHLMFIFSLIGHLSLPAQAETDLLEESPDYLQDVRPILQKYCSGCHNAEDLEGDFSVESFSTLMAGGESGPEIVPGNASDSRLIRVLTGREKPRMPPRKEPQLNPTQIRLLEAWIQSGARGPARGVDEAALSFAVPDLPPAEGVEPALTALKYSPDGRTLAVAGFQSVNLMDFESGQLIRTLEGLPGKVNSIDYSRQGRLMVTASGISGLSGIATLWSMDSDEPLRFFSGHSDILYDAVFSPDGRLIATAGYDRRIIIWNADTGQQIREIKGHNGAVYDLEYSPDGKVLASAGADATVKLWKVETGERLDTLNQPLEEQYAVCFDPGGEYILAGGADNRIRFYRFLSREKAMINPILESRFAHEGAIVSLQVSPDGEHLVSTAEDKSVRTWQMPDLQPVQTLGIQSDVVSSVAIHPENSLFTLARLDGSMGTFRFLDGVDQKENAVVDLAPVSPAKSLTPGKTYGVQEREPNNEAREAQWIESETAITGRINEPGDSDWFRFKSLAGQEWILDVHAARNKSPLDSRIEVLDEFGNPMEQIQLQAIRDSWFTFRGKDSRTSDDFRLHNWQEMELNEYLYANGEVVRLWLYPRGPDSGFMVYPGFGNRFNYFGTSAMTHPLGEPCYIVRPFPPGSELKARGLPVFTLYHENDDDPGRRWGDDSWMVFKAPDDGNYIVRLSDTREFGGEDYTYELKVHPRRPDFNIRLEGSNPTISLGSGKEFTLRIERIDGYEGPVSIQVEGLPPGFYASSPIVIEAGQQIARGVINAAPDASTAGETDPPMSRLIATADIGGKQVTREVGSFGEIKIGDAPNLLVEIRPHGDDGEGFRSAEDPFEFNIRPGQTIQAKVLIHRNDFSNRVELGGADSGRNLAHGVYVDNIGLNGLLVVEGQSERSFFITAADWTPPSTRYFHLRTGNAGGHASWPARINVLPRTELSANP